MALSKLIHNEDYKNWLREIKQSFKQAQLTAAVKVNSTLLKFYWQLGSEIAKKQQSSTWGDGFLTQLSRDLSSEFTDIKGFSLRNLKYIRQWHHFWNTPEPIGQQAVANHDEAQFLLELGAGFAYIGKQIALQVGERDFYLDLLFYHTQLHCYVVIELKTGDFEPEHAGKLNFYIKVVDEQLKKQGDEFTIGILLCKNKDKLVAEYALSDINKPIGVSEYQLTQSLPESLQSSLPSIEEIEAGLAGEFGDGDDE